jgi:hypothetical protein
MSRFRSMLDAGEDFGDLGMYVPRLSFCVC